MVYTPTLVMMAKMPPTGAAAALYAGTSQKFSGHKAALARKATARMAAPACSMPRSASATCEILRAMSAMFKVPVMPYSMDTPIRNSDEATRLMAM